MIDVDNFNPLNRFLLKKDQQEQVAEGEEGLLTETKVVPIKPPRLRSSPLPQLSVTQLLLIPVALSGIYFYAIARDRYVTRSDFVIRKAEESDTNMGGAGLASLLGRGNQLSLEDARFLKTYLQSPQVLADLDRTYDLDQAYAQKGLDRFAGMKPDLS